MSNIPMCCLGNRSKPIHYNKFRDSKHYLTSTRAIGNRDKSHYTF